MGRELYMDVNYQLFGSMPDREMLDGIIQLHQVIFGTSDDLINKMSRKPRLLVITAMIDKKVIGYKVGYEIENNKFYSWLGGVDPNYRNLGIASKLMKKQHHYIKQRGYKVIQTKTINRWRSMLILNIKHGFDVIDIYTDENGLHKIILEKNLLK